MNIALWEKFTNRHRHEWEKVSEVTVESFFERYQGTLRLLNMGGWIFERKTVTFLRCKCGKTKRVIYAH